MSVYNSLVEVRLQYIFMLCVCCAMSDETLSRAGNKRSDDNDCLNYTITLKEGAVMLIRKTLCLWQ